MYRIALSKFRTSNHRLAIETGRWHKPQPIERNLRLCLTCEKLEDEYHLVAECIKYNELRNKYLPHHFINKPSMFEFCKLLSSGDTTSIKNFSVFIFKAMELHDNKM